MKGTILYLAGIALVSLVIAVGWTKFTLPAPEVPLSISCPERVAGVRGVALQHMKALQRAFQAIRKHVLKVEVSVDEAPEGAARYKVSLTMNSGSRVVASGRCTDWHGLDTTLAREVDRCLGEFLALRRSRGSDYSPVLLSI